MLEFGLAAAHCQRNSIQIAKSNIQYYSWPSSARSAPSAVNSSLRHFNPYAQFLQLFIIHRTGGISHQIDAILGLGEGNDIADVVGAGEKHDQAVEAKRHAAVWRRAVTERFEQESELDLLLVGCDAED